MSKEKELLLAKCKAYAALAAQAENSLANELVARMKANPPISQDEYFKLIAERMLEIMVDLAPQLAAEEAGL